MIKYLKSLFKKKKSASQHTDTYLYMTSNLPEINPDRVLFNFERNNITFAEFVELSEMAYTMEQNRIKEDNYAYAHETPCDKLNESQNQNNMNTKICFKSDGTKGTGAKIIAALIKLGGDNPSKKEGRADECYYCIDGNNIITYFTSIPIGYTLVDIYTYKHEEKREQHAEFTVEGSSALLEAFIKECECPLGRNGILSLERFIDPPIKECLLFTDKDNGITITSCYSKRNTHFILPNDWNKAMELAKDFFKPKDKSITVAGIEFKYNKMGELECEYGSINSGHLSKLRQAVIETRYCGKRIESIKIGCTDFTIKDISTLSDFFIEQQNK